MKCGTTTNHRNNERTGIRGIRNGTGGNQNVEIGTTNNNEQQIEQNVNNNNET